MRFQVRAFRGKKDVLSNLYPVTNKVVYKNVEYHSVEHGYKSQKAKCHGREDLALKVMEIQGAPAMMRMIDSELGVILSINIALYIIHHTGLYSRGEMLLRLPDNYVEHLK